AILIAGGAFGVYVYTSTPVNISRGPISTAATENGTPGPNTTSSSPSPAGNCVLNDQGQCSQPQGTWSAYLGYIPARYTPVPHSPYAAVYYCPSGMSPEQCVQFKATCGNGVCDPNESCATCPIDCSVAGQLQCDPYSGRAGSPISICQMPRGA